MENRPVIRRVQSLALALAVIGGAVCAPFLHAHTDDASAPRRDDDHHSTSVHAHFSSHAPAPVQHEGVSVEESERDHAIYLQAFVAVEAVVFQSPDLPRVTFALIPTLERAPRVPVIVTHGHDPPLVSALDSRPPPLFLS
jgi:hypothetical protein